MQAAALQKGEIRFLNLGWNIIGRGTIPPRFLPIHVAFAIHWQSPALTFRAALRSGGALQLARAVAQCSKLEALILVATRLLNCAVKRRTDSVRRACEQEGNAIDEEGASEILAEAEASLRAACAEAGASARGRVLSLNAEVRVHAESD